MKKFSALLLVLLVLAAAALPTASAVNGGTVVLQTYLVLPESENVPGQTFSYSIRPGTAQNETENNAKVYAGIGSPTISTAVFTAGQDTYTTVQTQADEVNTQKEKENRQQSEDPITGEQVITYTTEPLKDPVTLASGQKYARATVTVDFSGIDFQNPGVYRYVITQSATTSPTNGGLGHGVL